MRGATNRRGAEFVRIGNFNSRAPCGARHQTFISHAGITKFQLTRPMRGATRKRDEHLLEHGISTHAPHAGRDAIEQTPRAAAVHFNSRAPCGARRPPLQRHGGQIEFQLTRPMRGATTEIAAEYFVPPISTHAPHAGRDFVGNGGTDICCAFQLTRPMRGATKRYLRRCLHNGISTHAPHAGRDMNLRLHPHKPANFNSRAPCGARPCSFTHSTCALAFQLTRPMRGATPKFFPERLKQFISTHAPHAGRDTAHRSVSRSVLHFNSRAPCGARLDCAFQTLGYPKFQLTRPMRGATSRRRQSHRA